MELTAAEFRILRDFIEKECGIALGEDKAYLVESRLGKLVRQTGCDSFGMLHQKASTAGSGRPLRDSIVDAITTKETSWFRDPRVFAFLQEAYLPEANRAIREGRRGPVRIWSAACATGQEPYSVGIAAQEAYLGLGGRALCNREIAIFATDVSRAALRTAEAGEYDAMAMQRGLSEDLRRRYFRQREDRTTFDALVREMVEFREFNLADSPASFGTFDIVLLRNVLIYFSDEFKRDLFERIADVLAPGGYLFLGTGETATGYTPRLRPVDLAGLLCYRPAEEGS